jgi:FHA domain-containing protein
MCQTHNVDLVPPSRKRKEPPAAADPGDASQLGLTADAEARCPPPPDTCWHCGAPIPDLAARRCLECAEPLIRRSLLIEFAGGQVTVAAGEQTVLGRCDGESPHAQVFAAYGNVSRLHATIGIDRGGAWIVDEQSTNGTFVNGALIDEQTRHPLADGDQVRLGAAATGRVKLSPPP